MKKSAAVVIIVLCALFTLAGTAGADELMANPSFYSGGAIAVDMESYWLANYLEIMEYMKTYPDFMCEHYSNSDDGEKFDQIVCSSVNNARTKDVVINFYFTGDHAGMTGLQETVFTIGAPEPLDIQLTLEYYWLPEAFPWHWDSDSFYKGMTSLVFHTGKTVLRFDMPDYDGEGDDYVTVDLWDINGGRLGVG